MQSHYLQFDVRISFRVGLTMCHSSNVARRRGEFAIDAKIVHTFLHLLNLRFDSNNKKEQTFLADM